MKHTKTYIAALIITATVFMNVSAVFAQEWRVLLRKGLFQENQISKTTGSKSVEKIDWLATQTPMLKNTPIPYVSPNPRPAVGLIFDSEYSQVGSWAPLPSPAGKEGFTLLSF